MKADKSDALERIWKRRYKRFPQKRIAGILHVKVPCQCGNLIWASAGNITPGGVSIRLCSECRYNAGPRAGTKDYQLAADIRYHGD